uniref:Uncharacterized protein n=1 Tax=Aegilops tauschii subsp. strangulata TaxID=200361 RepID=A0A453LA23_AEGTS
MDEFVLKCSNDHLEHTGGTGYGGSSEFLPSMHELSDESDGYATPPSDFVSRLLSKALHTCKQ